MKKIIALLAIFAMVATPALAKPPWSAKEAPSKASAVEKVGDEIADSMADVLTGNTSTPKTKSSLPPGLAKKDKVPPGWQKGVKKEDSPIKQFFKKLFGSNA